MNNKKSQIIFLIVILAVLLTVVGIFTGVKLFQNSVSKEGAVPDAIAVTFSGDPKTTKGFAWYTKESSRSDVQILKYTGQETADFSNALTFKGSVSTIDDKYPVDTNSKSKQPKLNNTTMSFHQVTANKLEADTKYWYRVGDTSLDIWSETAFLETAPGNNFEFTFISLTDTQGFDEKDYSVWKFVLDNSFKMFPKAKFVLNAGDFVENDINERQWQLLFDVPKSILMNTTIVPAAGNHDNQQMMTHFTLPDTNNMGSQSRGYYSYDYSNAHFTVLNTNDSVPEMSTTQIEWLKNDLSVSKSKWKIVVMHKSIYTNANHVNDKDIAVLKSQLMPIFEQYGVDVVIEGHDHYYLRSQPMVAGAPSATETSVQSYGDNKVGFSINPKGPIYVMTATCGNKSYIGPLDDSVDIKPAFLKQTNKPCFAACTITENKLVYMAYITDKDTGKITPLDMWGIEK